MAAEDRATVLELWSKRHRDLGSRGTRLHCRIGEPAKLGAAPITRGRRGGWESRSRHCTSVTVGLGSFYNHFESKEELFEAAEEDVLELLGGLLDELTADIDDPAVVFAQSFRLFGRFHRRNPEMSKVFLFQPFFRVVTRPVTARFVATSRTTSRATSRAGSSGTPTTPARYGWRLSRSVSR